MQSHASCLRDMISNDTDLMGSFCKSETYYLRRKQICQIVGETTTSEVSGSCVKEAENSGKASVQILSSPLNRRGNKTFGVGN
jgi:hypothetical protein